MPNALSIQHLTKTYKNNVRALKGISLNIAKGDFFALLGPNGAGKSTAIGIICSLTNKTAGSVEIYGYDLDKEKDKAKSYIGLVPQEFNFNMFEPVYEIVVNQAGYYGIPRKKAAQRAELLLKQLGLWEKRRDMARELSGGMKRRLMIARALVHEPTLLILDEPTAGVDIEIRRSMWVFLEEINKQGTTIILTTHYLEEAEALCRNIAIINKGEIIENTSMKTLLAQLHVETFILDLKESINKVPEVAGYNIVLLDSSTLSVEIKKTQTVNEVFDELSRLNLHVTSMRNKSNRLEELFVRLTGNQIKDDAQG
ncbi:Uncharacterized ABC transporter ATP-binding protein YadG [hydrothermal vent metagenome]|uniref:Uncharacterized ABC transporter ATP-binding protein YadG n=1 Tax=hydrothermal vent metagenome TaxID=652676 RepID=A0A3B0ZE02_9ZZZZ